MPWFKIDDGFHCHTKVMAAGTPAIGLYVRCGSWAAQQTSDGIVPKSVARMYGTAHMIRALIDAGLWHEKGHDCESCPQVDAKSIAIHDYLQFNPSRNTVYSEREAKTERQRRWRENRRANAQLKDGEAPFEAVPGDAGVDASTPPSVDASVDPPVEPAPTRPDPTPTTTSSSEEAKRAQPTRIDVEQACTLLADLIEANGSRRPHITQQWRDEARRMIDLDKVPLADVLGAIRWSQNDPFWRSNILSMPKLRKQYDALRLRALGQSQTAHQTPPGHSREQAYAERGIF
jgi:hypothetical protein